MYYEQWWIRGLLLIGKGGLPPIIIENNTEVKHRHIWWHILNVSQIICVQSDYYQWTTLTS